MNINLIIIVVMLGLFGNKVLQRVILHYVRRCFANTPAERKLIDVRVLVLGVRCSQLFSKVTAASDTLLLVPIRDILLRYLVSLRFHKLALYRVFERVDADRILHILTSGEYRVGDTRYLLFRNTVFFSRRHVGVAYRIEYLFLRQRLDFSASLYHIHTILLEILHNEARRRGHTTQFMKTSG